ncbi:MULTISPECIES: hypothetical protein [unclassified Rathayibacter]|uniref:hypothetical protein n=1 Tax=unclassified Rathayibacter TaxID=2609250 RepID=UPI0006F4FF72|nr:MULTISPECIES: hypothetical protein [unclassified Rathayibacter]KQQ05566.1 hypothetical protein ASF42_03080 [Rathayibacter sp. Leaf294]KQS13429.1 hypothetical protein ASG06_03095 [Rathayibacter sp. Leaf185]
MKTLFHTGGSVDLENETAAAVIRYSLALAHRREMGTVTLDDAGHPESRSQVQIVVGLGVPLSVHGVLGPDEVTRSGDTGADIDARTAGLGAPLVVGLADGPDHAEAYDYDYDVGFDLELI